MLATTLYLFSPPLFSRRNEPRAAPTIQKQGKRTMPGIISSVIIASASATAKVFVIGGIGYWSACRPKASPILPNVAMTGISKMNFNLLLLPLIYSTIASSVTPQKLGSLWFILVSALVVISTSYGVATVLGKLPFFRVQNKIDFDALRIAAAFPNILALPILIFPTLCEFAVVHDSFYNGENASDGGPSRYHFYFLDVLHFCGSVHDCLGRLS